MPHCKKPPGCSMAPGKWPNVLCMDRTLGSRNDESFWPLPLLSPKLFWGEANLELLQLRIQ